MSDEKSPKRLLKLSEAIQGGANIRAQPPVAVLPVKRLDSWSIVKVIEEKAGSEKIDFHFIGRDLMERNGAVSSKIVEFDPQRMQGKTQSGRIYQLVGHNGYDGDALYVLRNWCNIYQVVAVDATQEFLQSHGVSEEDC